ncbi:MAG: hypothetical protein ACP6IS_07565 [Candidatus Asgardarchaeia archaeon]
MRKRDFTILFLIYTLSVFSLMIPHQAMINNHQTIISNICTEKTENRIISKYENINPNWTKSLEISAIGIPYLISVPVGNFTILKYYLYANKTYEIFLYGGFVYANADYDIFILNANFTKVKVLANDPAEEEHDTFKPLQTGFYYFEVINNPYTSNAQSYAFLAVFEQFNISVSKTSYTLELYNFTGGNKTYSVPLFNSSYGFIVNVKGFSDNKFTVIAHPTKNLAVKVSLYEFSSSVDKATYEPTSNQKSTTLIDSNNGELGEKVKVSFIIGRRGYEHTNDTAIVIFLKALKGEGNITIEIILEKTHIEVDILPYASVIIVLTIIFAVIVINEDKLRKTL